MMEDSRASAHRPRPLFELQDLGSVRTNSTIVDFPLTSILLPSGLSGLDGRALALLGIGNFRVPDSRRSAAVPTDSEPSANAATLFADGCFWENER